MDYCIKWRNPVRIAFVADKHRYHFILQSPIPPQSVSLTVIDHKLKFIDVYHMWQLSTWCSEASLQQQTYHHCWSSHSRCYCHENIRRFAEHVGPCWIRCTTHIWPCNGQTSDGGDSIDLRIDAPWLAYFTWSDANNIGTIWLTAQRWSGQSDVLQYELWHKLAKIRMF